MSEPDPEALSSEAKRWLSRVEDDLDMVAAALERGRPRPAAYHVKQAAEKLVKALLVLAGAQVPRWHDLGRLIGVAGIGAQLPGGAADRLAALTSWASIARYPDIEDETEPTIEEVAAALPLVRLLEDLVRARMDAGDTTA
jgi:HEPN domain-containing protein